MILREVTKSRKIDLSLAWIAAFTVRRQIASLSMTTPTEDRLNQIDAHISHASVSLSELPEDAVVLAHNLCQRFDLQLGSLIRRANAIKNADGERAAKSFDRLREAAQHLILRKGVLPQTPALIAMPNSFDHTGGFQAYCDQCDDWHFCETIDGHHECLCTNPNSPYHLTGYFIELGTPKYPSVFLEDDVPSGYTEIGRFELVMRAIRGVREPASRDRDHRIFTELGDKYFDRMVEALHKRGTDDCILVAEFFLSATTQVLDAETLKRWTLVTQSVLRIVSRPE